MRLAFVSLLILGFVLAPMYLLPHLIRNDSGDELVARAARDIVSEIPNLSGIQSVAVVPLENDYQKTLQFALVQEFRRSGRFMVIDEDLFPREKISLEKRIKRFKEEEVEPADSSVRADSILTGRIHRNEMPGSQHLIDFEAVLLSPMSGEILWTTSWRGSTRISRPELERKKSALLICLAFAAGILVIYARKEDRI